VLTRAFGCATPVIASDIEGYREVITPETAVAVPPGDVAALVEAVEGLLADEERRRAMGEAARTRAQAHFSWPDIARRLEQIYERVTARDPGRATEAVAA
jgi:glycosyltransferase involved in cell wall biosynthesis